MFLSHEFNATLMKLHLKKKKILEARLCETGFCRNVLIFPVNSFSFNLGAKTVNKFKSSQGHKREIIFF